jgi:hypothetical protein
MYLTRFIWFVYGTSIVYSAGMRVPLGYRGFLNGIYSQLLEEIYDAYFGSGYPRVFRNPISVGSVKLSSDYIIQNNLFIEMLIFLTLRFLELKFICILKNGDKYVHLVCTLRRVFGIFFAMYWWAYALNWFQNMHTVHKFKSVSYSNE